MPMLKMCGALITYAGWFASMEMTIGEDFLNFCNQKCDFQLGPVLSGCGCPLVPLTLSCACKFVALNKHCFLHWMADNVQQI